MIKIVKFKSIGEVRKGETKKGKPFQSITARLEIVGTEQELIAEVFEMDGEFKKVNGVASIDKTQEYKVVLSLNSNESNGRFYNKISLVKFLPLEGNDVKELNTDDWITGQIENVDKIFLNSGGLLLNTLITTVTGQSIEIPVFTDSDEKYIIGEWLLAKILFDVEEYQDKEYLKIKIGQKKLISEIFVSQAKNSKKEEVKEATPEPEKKEDADDDLPF